MGDEDDVISCGWLFFQIKLKISYFEVEQKAAPKNDYKSINQFIPH